MWSGSAIYRYKERLSYCTHGSLSLGDYVDYCWCMYPDFFALPRRHVLALVQQNDALTRLFPAI